jgi:outer membrane protein OmpA-like peptidoglycan-associated protein
MRALALAAGLLPSLAAGADDPTRRDFDADPLRAALSLDGGWAVETAAAAPRGRWGAALLLGWTEGLLPLRLGDEHDHLIVSRFGANLLGAWSLGPVELGADLPVVLWQDSDLSLLEQQGVTGALVDPVAETTLGDLRLGAKWALLAAERNRLRVGVAALGEVRLPTGDGQAFAGDGFMVVPGAVITRAFGPVRLDGQIGYQFRDEGQYAQLVVQDGVTWGIGAALDLPPNGAFERWRAHAEVGGGIPRGDVSTDRYQAPLSARALLRAFVHRNVAVDLGAGAGLGDGYGRETWRIFGGVRWSPVPRPVTPDDRDGDGVRDADDACPDVPGRPELDGCPDRDGDEVPDREDRCPDRPGPASADGCPPAEGEPLVEITTDRLSLKDAIQFDTAKDTIKPGSFRVLDEIARILQEHSEVRRVRVEGHTDDVGSATYNKDLSQRRAASVVRYLAGRGVARERLVPEGFGEERPVASNKTALGRAKNRRVEFTLVAEGGGGK